MPPSRSSSRSSSPSNKLPTLQTQSQRSQVKSFSDEESSSSSSHSEKKRAKKRPSINTRASRVGVTNFINVIKSLHPGESINYFPITEETLCEYIDSKKKSLIKSGSLEQYLQHIQAYNLALGFGWDGRIFGPIIKRALDELKEYDDDIMRPNKQQESSHQISLISPIPEEDSMVLDAKPISIVCFDTKTVPSKILDAQAQINLDNLKYAEPLLNLRKLYQNVAAADLSKYWGGNIDDSQLFYRNCTKDSFVHLSLNNEEAFVLFWTSFNERKEIIELVVYRKNNITNNNDNNTNFNNITSPQIIPNNLINNPINNSINSQMVIPRQIHPTPEPLLTSPKQFLSFEHDVFIPVLKSVTIRSPSRIYKKKIAVTDNTTFVSLISFAIKKSLPPGKQFVIRAPDGLEYIPDDFVRTVITGVEHAEIILTIEDIGPIDFDCF